MNIYDPTQISEERVLTSHVRKSLFKLVFHLCHFLGYMYMAVITIAIA